MNKFNEPWAETVQKCIDDKWTVLAKKPNSEETSCLLCERSDPDNTWFDCSLCPISKMTGERCCNNTPYDNWIKLKYPDYKEPLQDLISAAAYEEIAFLYKVKIYCIENDLGE